MFRYILDTNIFNRALDGNIDLGALKPNVELFATHIELTELQKTKDPMRRTALLEVFRAAGPKQIPTESAVWDVSQWDAAKWASEDNVYQSIVASLNKKNGGKSNNPHDALIAETAERNGFILVTEDGDLADVAAEHNVSVIGIELFLRDVVP